MPKYRVEDYRLTLKGKRLLERSVEPTFYDKLERWKLPKGVSALDFMEVLDAFERGPGRTGLTLDEESEILEFLPRGAYIEYDDYTTGEILSKIEDPRTGAALKVYRDIAEGKYVSGGDLGLLSMFLLDRIAPQVEVEGFDFAGYIRDKYGKEEIDPLVSELRHPTSRSSLIIAIDTGMSILHNEELDASGMDAPAFKKFLHKLSK